MLVYAGVALVAIGVIWMIYTIVNREKNSRNKLSELRGEIVSHLDQGEPILAMVLGAYESKIMGQDTVRVGTFAATDRRLVFYGKKAFGYDMEIFPYSNISSIEQGKDAAGHRLSFFASGNRVSMKWINTGELPQLVQEVRTRIGKPAQQLQALPATDDIPTQIRKLSELRDSGVLTDTEFASKKADLLERM